MKVANSSQVRATVIAETALLVTEVKAYVVVLKARAEVVLLAESEALVKVRLVKLS